MNRPLLALDRLKMRVNPDWAGLPLFDRKGWKRVRFGDVVRVLKEQIDPDSGEVDRYVAGEHMETENVHIRNWGNVGDGYLGPAFIRRFRKGQVLYGSRRTYLKKVSVAEWDGVTSNTTLVLEAVEGKLLQELLPWLMLSERFTRHSVQESKGSTNPYINWPDIAKFEFSLPPMDQQRRIATILSIVDATLNKYYELLGHLNALRTSYANKAYSLIPGNKRSAPTGSLEDLSEINPTLGERLTDDTLVSFVTMADVSEKGRITQMTVRPYREVKKGFTAFREGDLLFAKITPCMENGKGAIAIGLESGIGFGSTEFHVLRPKNEADRRFLYHLTMTTEFRVQAKRFMRGSAGQLRVPSDFLKDFRLSLPKPERRVVIGDNLEKMTAQIDSVSNVHTSLRTLQTRLIQQLCAG